MGFWQKLKKLYMGDVFGAAISEADEAFFEDLEEMLILADVGMETAGEVTAELRRRMIEDKIAGQEPVKACLREILAERLEIGDKTLNLSTRPSVLLVIGVNGVGKTTSIGKLANLLPCGGSGPAGDLGQPGKVRACAPARGGGPGSGALRRHSGG